jgi:hypothetical protein
LVRDEQYVDLADAPVVGQRRDLDLLSDEMPVSALIVGVAFRQQKAERGRVLADEIPEPRFILRKAGLATRPADGDTLCDGAERDVLLHLSVGIQATRGARLDSKQRIPHSIPLLTRSGIPVTRDGCYLTSDRGRPE